MKVLKGDSVYFWDGSDKLSNGVIKRVINECFAIVKDSNMYVATNSVYRTKEDAIRSKCYERS